MFREDYISTVLVLYVNIGSEYSDNARIYIPKHEMFSTYVMLLLRSSARIICPDVV